LNKVVSQVDKDGLLEHETVVSLHFRCIVHHLVVPCDVVLGDTWLLTVDVPNHLIEQNLGRIIFDQLRVPVIVVHIIATLIHLMEGIL
jgi:hypothetical protein